jgi:UDP-N-acetyl-D-mannosaminuronic acid transferase (WecB/TagA/CpsF family)
MLDKLFAGSAKDAIDVLEKTYMDKWFCMVNFLYFANAMQYRLFETARSEGDVIYKESLLHSDLLLPDGIALQMWDSWIHKPKRWLHNLNGTDLSPQILSYFASQYTVHLYISSLYDENIGKWKEWLDTAVEICKKRYGIQTVFAFQTHYRERGKIFPFQEREQHSTPDKIVKIFLNCTWTPFQEVWTYKNRKRFQDNRMMVLNVGWFIDFLSWFESRAPKRVVKMRVLETFWRIITNPKKNLKKFLAMFGVVRLVAKRIVGSRK